MQTLRSPGLISQYFFSRRNLVLRILLTAWYIFYSLFQKAVGVKDII
jgi:hypothetical protein